MVAKMNKIYFFAIKNTEIFARLKILFYLCTRKTTMAG